MKSNQPLTALSPSDGEREKRRPSVGENGHVKKSEDRLLLFPFHEPTHPQPLPGGEQNNGTSRPIGIPLLGGVRGGFMVPMRGQKTVESPHEPERRAPPRRGESGAKVARTPNASRQRGRSVPRVSVWSAGGFSAALAQPRANPTVQGFKARIVSGNSLPTRCDGATARRVGWGEGQGEGIVPLRPL